MGERAQNRRELLEISARLPPTLSACIAEKWVDWLAHIVETQRCDDFSGAPGLLTEEKYSRLFIGIGKRRATRLGARFERDADDKPLFWSQPFFRQMWGMRTSFWSEGQLMQMTADDADELLRVYGRA